MMFHMKQKGSWESSFLRVRMASRERRLVRLELFFVRNYTLGLCLIRAIRLSKFKNYRNS